MSHLLLPLSLCCGLTLSTLLISAAAQLSSVVRGDLASLCLSVAAVATLGGGVVALGGPCVSLLLFGLVVAAHTVVPVTRTVSVGLAVVLTLGHLGVSTWRSHRTLDDYRFYTQVSRDTEGDMSVVLAL